MLFEQVFVEPLSSLKNENTVGKLQTVVLGRGIMVAHEISGTVGYYCRDIAFHCNPLYFAEKEFSEKKISLFQWDKIKG